MRTKTREKAVPNATLTATVIAGIDNATAALHLALKDGTLDANPKIMDAVRAFVRASRGWNVSADGGSVDVDAIANGEGNGKKGDGQGCEKGKSSKNENKNATDNVSEKVSTVRQKDTLQGTATRESTMRKPKLGNIMTTRRATEQV